MSVSNGDDEMSSEFISGLKMLCCNQTIRFTNIFTTIVIIILLLFLLVLRTAGLPYFDRKNVMDFLDNWENLYIDYDVNKSTQIQYFS